MMLFEEVRDLIKAAVKVRIMCREDWAETVFSGSFGEYRYEIRVSDHIRREIPNLAQFGLEFMARVREQMAEELMEKLAKELADVY